MVTVNRYRTTILLLLALLLCITLTAWAVDSPDHKARLAKPGTFEIASPIVPDNWKFHQIGTLWSRVTNFSYMGDDAYEGRTPSCDYPGGSGNSYLYRGTIWLTALVDGTPHSTQGDDHEFSPLDSVHVYSGPGARSEEDTYTRYYDVSAPLASGHFPLGVEVVERTYAWSASWAGDFIIYEYTVKNVGVDSDGDQLPDKPRDLDQFYFTIRFDGDVSKLPSWGAESRFCNIDDYVLSNAQPWNSWIKDFPQMAGRAHSLTEADLDSSMIFMWDGDNPSYPADNGVDDDFGNPGADGRLQTPGFLGFKILKTEPYLKPSSFHQCQIYNDPASDQEAWTKMISVHTYDGLIYSKGKPYAYDFRGILSFGPIEKFAYGDSFKVTAALSVGSDPDSGGVYSLMKLVKNFNTAQFIVDNDYKVSSEALAPAAPQVRLEQVLDGSQVTGIRVVWDDAATAHAYFEGYKIWKAVGKNSQGAYDWVPLGAGTYSTLAGGTWPPPAGDQAGTFALVDNDIVNGFEYYYAVQSYTRDINDPIPLGVIQSNILNSIKSIAPANPVAATLDNVKVVPNPYIGSVIWNNPMPSDNEPWQHRIQFTNLPADATVKIFTLDGDYIDEIRAGYTARRTADNVAIEGADSVAEWDIITRNNQEAAPGIYMYVVDSPSLGQKIGKFVIIQ